MGFYFSYGKQKKKIVSLSSPTFSGRGRSGWVFFVVFSPSFSHKISVGRENFFKTFYFLKNIFGWAKSWSVGRENFTF